MEFELTSELIDEIVFSMEDQTGMYLLDSEKAVLVKKNEVNDDDPDRYYVLPVWDSISGFRLMERFVASLKNPPVREQLRSILRSGHGVFRNFKNVLKEHHEVEKLWFAYKEQEMKLVIRGWYNDLREVWGLEQLGDPPEENAELVHEDFTFQIAEEPDLELLGLCVKDLQEEVLNAKESEFGKVLSALIGEQNFSFSGKENFSGTEKVFTAENIEGEFAGFVYYVPYVGKENVFKMPLLYVQPQYRGLGVGRELLQMSLTYMQKHSCKYILSNAVVMPDFFRKVLEREGFRVTGSLLYLDFENRL